MRPIKLVMSAFGPYIKPDPIDFTTLEDNNFFLIHGATGAGKSSIFDAICFALYGEAADKERKGKMLRNKQAPADMKTYVEFVFTVRDATWRIWRNPEYTRQVKRGTGMTKEMASATLERLENGEIVEHYAGIKEVGDRIQSLLGFACDQFRQVVLLPQGEFRRFLAADTKERKEIMHVLFATEKYEKIENKLRDRAKDLKDEIDKAENERKGLLKGTNADDEAGLAELITSHKQELETLSVQVAELDTALKTKRAAREAGAVLAQSFTELAQAQQRLAQLDEQTEELNKLANRLELAERGATLDGIALLVRTKKDELAEKEREIAKIEANGKRAAEDKTVKEKAYQVAKAQENEIAILQQRSGELNALVPVAKSLATDEQKEKRLAREVTHAAQQLRQAEQQLQASTARCAECEQRLAGMRELQRAARAALLAEDLADGTPCPVCGATEHPQLAHATVELIRDEDIERLEAELSDAHQAQNQAQAARDRAVTAHSAAQQAHTAIAASVQEKQAQLPESWRVAGAVERELTTVQRQAAQLTAALNTALNEKQKADTIHEQKQTEWRKTNEYIKKLNTEVEKHAAEFSERLTAAGFASAAEYQVAVSAPWDDADYRKQQREKITAHKRYLHAAQENLLKCKSKTAGKAQPDMTALQAAETAAQAAWQQANNDKVAKETRLEQLKTQAESLAQLAQKTAKIEREQQMVSHLEEIATGKGGNKVSFQTYVLHTLLDDVMEAANVRLLMMSRGQYELKSGERLTANKQGGLDIEVLDKYSDEARPIATLSGGESFLASLSLALGLADVVQSGAGARSLDTMFIDEGFGTLDSETLDVAIKALFELQNTGRLIGIISHVEELKQRIPARLEVTKTRDGGSDTKFIV